MTHLSELLDDAVGPVRVGFRVEDLTPRVKRRRRNRCVRFASGVIVLVLVAALAFGGLRHGRSTAPEVNVHPTVPTSQDVLVFDATGGIITVDPAHRVAIHHPINGWRAGDQPFMSLRVGDAFVVGWDGVYAAPIGAAAPRRLGTGVFVPAVEPGDVWLTSYGQVQTTTERLVDTRGRVILEAAAPKEAAVTGIPGGLVLQGGTGLDIWDARTGRITRHLGTLSAAAAPAFGSLLAWCDACTRSLELTDVRSGATRSIPVALDGSFLSMDRVIFSPDGRELAIPVWPDGSAPIASTAKVIIVNVATGAVTRPIDTGKRYATLAWSPDGQRVFIAATTDGHGGELLVHDLASNRTSDLGQLVAGAGNLSSVMTRADAPRLSQPAAGPSGDCRAVSPADGLESDPRVCRIGF